ncbi:histidine phosphatase family protein [Aliiroseovarius sp. 2305UL8-7]|uniref:histidine phosphatase family protein n=1 Tax=Aliiroseovarius conchicola TaxID=3121637 RepID=UPI003529208E
MARNIRYLSHPQVLIDPAKDVRNWSLSNIGARRVQNLIASNALSGTATIVSSAETKATETAIPLADACGAALIIREVMHENDRSATGYLPPAEFEAVADQFFSEPDQSVRGWETANSAQKRIVGEVQKCLRDYPRDDLLFVGHGAVGTLLYCFLAGTPINRKFDQGPNGGGCYLEFSGVVGGFVSWWRPMEDLVSR